MDELLNLALAIILSATIGYITFQIGHERGHVDGYSRCVAVQQEGQNVSHL